MKRIVALGLMSLVVSECKAQQPGSETLAEGVGPAQIDNGQAPVFDEKLKQYFQLQLQQYEQSPSQFMNKHIQKDDLSGTPVDDHKSFL